MKVSIGYIGRVEGEGAVEFELDGKGLSSLKVNIWEPPRFFEGMLVGRRFDEAPDIVSRICGICPVSHMGAAIRAMENAIGFEPSAQTLKIRRLMSASQIAASHLVHLVMLALPDYYGKTSLVELIPQKDVLLKRFLKMKDAINAVTAGFGGRALHPVSMVVGGFTGLPSEKTVKGLYEGLSSIREDANRMFEIFAGLDLPPLETETELVGLSADGQYALEGGRLVSDKGIIGDEARYREVFEEAEVHYSNAKRTKVKERGSLLVGALSRVTLQHDALPEQIKALAAKAGISSGGSKNPFLNIRAQMVEIIYFIEECLRLLGEIELRNTYRPPKPKAGVGAGLVEAPRGLLYHRYSVDGKGVIREADIVTPTAHNYMGLEENLRRLIEAGAGRRPIEEISKIAEMLVRAYDPCFSCSVH